MAYGAEAFLLKPGVFMNTSGGAVQRVATARGVTAEDTLVICDDLALPVGQLRLRGEGSAGGHRGLESVIQHLGTTAFPRLRVGIGAPPAGVDPADFVLSEFTRDEWVVMEPAIATAAECAAVWLREGVAAAMSRFNRMRPRLAEQE